MRRAISYSFALVMLLSCFAYGQYAGTIRGTVTDPTGAAVAGAQVTVKNPATDLTREVTTSDQGDYTVTALPAGLYEVTVKQANFKESVIHAVEVHGSSSVVVDAKLATGTITETMVVEASAPKGP